MPYNAKKIPNLFIKEELVPTSLSFSRSVACCAFNATNEFMKHWLGMSLDENDRKWYSSNSLVTPDGLPQINTFTVIQQLIEPYGVGIRSIQVPKNTRRFPEQVSFISALGANPFFKLDGITTNAEAYERLFPAIAQKALGLDTPLKKANHKKETFAKWRFECVEIPSLGAIAMKQFQLQSAGHNGGSNYYGPRAKFNVGEGDQWLMAIKLDRLDNIDYLAAIELPKYKVYEGSKVYQWMSIKDNSGKTLSQIAPYTSYSGNNKRNSNRAGGTNSGSGVFKSLFFSGPLKKLGFSDEKILKMSWQTAAALKDGERRSDEVLITPAGNWIVAGKGNTSTAKRNTPPPLPLLPAVKSKETEEDTVTAYPPLCNACQGAPGNTVYVNSTLACQNCGAEQETSTVPVSYLLDGWIKKESYDDDDFWWNN